VGGCPKTKEGRKNMTFDITSVSLHKSPLSKDGVSESLNDELSQIEAVVRRCKQELKNGTVSVECILQHMRNGPDPTRDMAKAQEYVNALTNNLMGRININRLAELKNQHPDNSRICELGSRGAKCHLMLCEVFLTASDRQMTSDFKAKMQIPSVREQLNGVVKLLSMMGLLTKDSEW